MSARWSVSGSAVACSGAMYAGVPARLVGDPVPPGGSPPSPGEAGPSPPASPQTGARAGAQLRSGLVMTAGSVEWMFARPLPLIFLVVSIVLLVWPLWGEWRARRDERSRDVDMTIE